MTSSTGGISGVLLLLLLLLLLCRDGPLSNSPFLPFVFLFPIVFARSCFFPVSCSLDLSSGRKVSSAMSSVKVPKKIYHVVQQKYWSEAQSSGKEYFPPTYEAGALFYYS